jgi:hypothetical protein
MIGKAHEECQAATLVNGAESKTAVEVERKQRESDCGAGDHKKGGA